MPSVFDGLVRSYTLSQPAVVAGVDVNGNLVPGRAEVSFRASIGLARGRAAAGLIEQYGAEGADAILTGEMLDPVTLPDGVGVGWECDFDWAGQSGRLTIISIGQDPLSFVEEITGQFFYAKWVRRSE